MSDEIRTIWDLVAENAWIWHEQLCAKKAIDPEDSVFQKLAGECPSCHTHAGHPHTDYCKAVKA